MKMLMKILNKNISKQACCIDLRNSDLFHRTRSKCTANIHETLTAVLPLRCATWQMRSTDRQSAQCCLVLAHFQHSKFSIRYIYIYVIRYIYIYIYSSAPSKLRMRSTTRQFTQCCLVLAHFQHSKFNTVYMDIYIYRIAPLTLGTLHWSCAYVVAQLHALSAQQNKHLLSVEFS